MGVCWLSFLVFHCGDFSLSLSFHHVSFGKVRGTLHKIALRLEMQLNYGTLECIQGVVEGVIECARSGLEYTGEVGVVQRLKSQLIPTTSSDAQHIADWYEDGFGLRRTTEMLNEIRIERGDMHVGVSAVHNCVLRLAALARPVLPHTQSGGEDWRKAVHGWAAQIMVWKGMEILIEHHPALHRCVFRQAGFVRQGWTPPLT